MIELIIVKNFSVSNKNISFIFLKNFFNSNSIKLLFVISCNSLIDTVSLILIKNHKALFNSSILFENSLIVSEELNAVGKSLKKLLYFLQNKFIIFFLSSLFKFKKSLYFF